jgi:hypothetical protein
MINGTSICRDFSSDNLSFKDSLSALPGLYSLIGSLMGAGTLNIALDI